MYQLLNLIVPKLFFGICCKVFSGRGPEIAEQHIYTGFFLQIQVRAYDGGFPTLSDTTFVDVNVIRVTDTLSFFTANYFETITENLPVASSVLTVSAQPAVS